MGKIKVYDRYTKVGEPAVERGRIVGLSAKGWAVVVILWLIIFTLYTVVTA